MDLKVSLLKTFANNQHSNKSRKKRKDKMDKTTEEILTSYYKWNIYVRSVLKSNIKSCFILIKANIAIASVIGNVLLSKTNNKKEITFNSYEKFIEDVLKQGEIDTIKILKNYKQFLESFTPLAKKTNQNLKIDDAIIENLAKRKANYQA